jgi:hypothetical protein
MLKLHGVDVYIQSTQIPDVPKEFGNMKLLFISNRGTRVWPGVAPDLSIMDLFRCRYESDGEVSNGDVDSLLQDLTGRNLTWPQAQKLFWKDSERLYSQPY